MLFAGEPFFAVVFLTVAAVFFDFAAAVFFAEVAAAVDATVDASVVSEAVVSSEDDCDEFSVCAAAFAACPEFFADFFAHEASENVIAIATNIASPFDNFFILNILLHTLYTVLPLKNKHLCV